MTSNQTTPSAEYLAILNGVKNAKSANKSANKSATKPAAAAGTETREAGELKFYPSGAARPGKVGRTLFAYTLAWLHASGMLDGGTAPRSVITRVAGSRAVDYHTKSTGYISDAKGSLTLTEDGRNYFLQRGYDAADVAAYIEIMATGKPDGRLVKNPGFIAKL